MKQSLQLRLGQHLTMTPQLQQAIRLLQLSTLELQMEVQEALESNLMLEADEEGNNPAAETNGEDREPEQDVAPGDIPSELPVDSAWEDVYDGLPVHQSAPELNGLDFENPRPEAETLNDHLLWQLGLTHMSELDLAIATAVIDSINEDGYLSASLEDIRESLSAPDLEIDEAEFEAVLHQIQNFDPVGVGARDLRECLLIQLRHFPDDTPWLQAAVTLVREHLDLLGQRDFSQLMRLLKIEKEELQEVITLIKTLTPRPGDAIQSTLPEYIIPDVFVRNIKGVWRVELNPDAFPKVRVNSQYASLIRRADNSADNNCLKTHLQEARWLIKSLRSRSETLLKVATCIVERQKGFLEFGEEAMKPMVLHDVAEEVSMHESTISRVTTQKFMHTPRGVYELKYFFSSHVFTESGAECSSTAIRALLKKLIAAENAQKPLSDSKLAGILSEQGIKVARRTVAKYRESMAIPSSSERKSLM